MLKICNHKNEPTCRLLVYWELSSDLFRLKKAFPIVSEWLLGSEYAVNPITFGSRILCWLRDTTTSSESPTARCNWGLIWKQSMRKKKEFIRKYLSRGRNRKKERLPGWFLHPPAVTPLCQEPWKSLWCHTAFLLIVGSSRLVSESKWTASRWVNVFTKSW